MFSKNALFLLMCVFAVSCAKKDEMPSYAFDGVNSSMTSQSLNTIPKAEYSQIEMFLSGEKDASVFISSLDYAVDIMDKDTFQGSHPKLGKAVSINFEDFGFPRVDADYGALSKGTVSGEVTQESTRDVTYRVFFTGSLKGRFEVHVVTSIVFEKSYIENDKPGQHNSSLTSQRYVSYIGKGVLIDSHLAFDAYTSSEKVREQAKYTRHRAPGLVLETTDFEVLKKYINKFNQFVKDTELDEIGIGTSVIGANSITTLLPSKDKWFISDGMSSAFNIDSIQKFAEEYELEDHAGSTVEIQVRSTRSGLPSKAKKRLN